MLRRFLIILSLILTTPIFTSLTYAHEAGHEFIILYNGEEGIKPEFSGSVEAKDFFLPEERSPRVYKTGENLSLTFEPSDDFVFDSVSWDTGELAGVQTGNTINLLLETPGSYPIILETQNAGEKITHTTLITVSGQDNFTPTEAKILVNGEEVRDINSQIDVDLTKEVTFEAQGDSEFRYIWNFDNGDIKEGQSVNYKFSENPYLANPILRVIDKEGIYTDTQINLKNNTFGKEAEGDGNYTLILLVVIVLLSIFIAGLIIAKRFLIQFKN